MSLSSSLNSQKDGKLIGITIGKNLSSKKHISNVSNITSNHLRALMRISKYLSNAYAKLLLEPYILQIFKYWPLTWIICSKTANNLIVMYTNYLACISDRRCRLWISHLKENQFIIRNKNLFKLHSSKIS